MKNNDNWIYIGIIVVIGLLYANQMGYLQTLSTISIPYAPHEVKLRFLPISAVAEPGSRVMVQTVIKNPGQPQLGDPSAFNVYSHFYLCEKKENPKCYDLGAKMFTMVRMYGYPSESTFNSEFDIPKGLPPGEYQWYIQSASMRARGTSYRCYGEPYGYGTHRTGPLYASEYTDMTLQTIPKDIMDICNVEYTIFKDAIFPYKLQIPPYCYHGVEDESLYLGRLESCKYPRNIRNELVKGGYWYGADDTTEAALLIPGTIYEQTGSTIFGEQPDEGGIKDLESLLFGGTEGGDIVTIPPSTDSTEEVVTVIKTTTVREQIVENIIYEKDTGVISQKKISIFKNKFVIAGLIGIILLIVLFLNMRLGKKSLRGFKR